MTMGRVMLAENKDLFSQAECDYSGWFAKGRAKKTKTSVVIAFFFTRGRESSN